MKVLRAAIRIRHRPGIESRRPTTPRSALSRPVVTRKNAYGSCNDDVARLAARIGAVTATAEMAGLNVLTYLTAYLDACGRNGGKPLAGPDLNDSYLSLDVSRPGHRRSCI